MSEDLQGEARPSRWRVFAAVLAAAVAGAFLSRLAFPPSKSSAERPSRPIVQIVRQQPGLPDLSDTVDRLCPSVALIIPRGASPSASVSPTGEPAPAISVSADGWLLASAQSLPAGQLDALFGDGRRTALTEVRKDPVSGLAIIRTDGQAGPPLAFTDQALPRVGQFGFAVNTPLGRGCSANAAMVESDFLADGGKDLSYVRLQADPNTWTGGLPFLAMDGRLLGISTPDPLGALIPAAIAAVIVDELIQNQLSPSTDFGFRVIDFSGPYSARLGNLRSGAGVALVQPKSTAERAGLQAGDIVTTVDDVPVSSASELNRALDAQPRTATITVQRASQQLKLTIPRAAAE